MRRPIALLASATVVATTCVAVTGQVDPAAALTPGANGRIAFASNRGDGVQFEIYTMNPDGTGVRQITSSAGDSLDPSYSPDGTHIVFTSDRDGINDIYTMRSDGSDVVRLTDNGPVGDVTPSYSPDGTRIVFASGRDEPAGDIYSMKVDGTDVIRLTDDPVYDVFPRYSPDGSHIVYQHDDGLAARVHVMNADGTEQTDISAGQTDLGPSYSPDGKLIVVARFFDGQLDIVTMKPDGSNVQNLTGSVDSESGPVFSPDGAKVAFRRTDATDAGGIFVMDADGSSPTQLTDQPSTEVDFLPVWGPKYTPCQGRGATITGTDGNDVITGTPGPDVIAGLGGNDVIIGGGGADTICGGTGNDTASYVDHAGSVTADLTGGVGDDGGAADGPAGSRDTIGSDVENLAGGSGPDTLVGNNAVNVLTANSGDDSVWGGTGADVLNGGSGDDFLQGNDGDDTIHGNSGDDVAAGADGTDRVYGDTGDDVLRGNEGDDLLIGGADGDQLVGGPGIDTARYDLDTRATGVSITIGAGAGDDGGSLDGPVGFRDTVGATVESLYGTNLADTLVGNDLDNTLRGLLGADTLKGLAGADRLIANDGVADVLIDCGAPAPNFAPIVDVGIDPAPVNC
ncbi:DUF5050 domain-containing protein [Nocardioides sp. MH1]|uniref:DUF5050 domain-containing protein n=1 Tax=Nocardioides sp. MH1 TaxID=3242490 RepID=UPI003520C3AC